MEKNNKNFLWIGGLIALGIFFMSQGSTSFFGGGESEVATRLEACTPGQIKCSSVSDSKYNYCQSNGKFTGLRTCPSNLKCKSDLGCVSENLITKQTSLQSSCSYQMMKKKATCINEKQFKQCNSNNDIIISTCPGASLCWEGEWPDGDAGCVDPQYRCTASYNFKKGKLTSTIMTKCV